MFDIIIRNGIVVDGTGAERRVADIAVKNGVIAKVAPSIAERAAREIDATGLVVAPGWVDIHTHYDGQATWDDVLAPTAWHGVTTLVMGNCGVGFAPARPDQHDTRQWTLDVGTQVAHGAVRAYVMGERGARNEAATPEDILAMKAIVIE